MKNLIFLRRIISAELLSENNFCGVTLGNLILRAETAVISALSCVIYEYED